MGAFFIVLFVLAALFVPFVVIWAVNTLFSTQIPYTFMTWLATVVLAVALRGHVNFSRSVK